MLTTTILRTGAIAGLITIVPMSAMIVAWGDNPPSDVIGMAIGYTTMLVALSLVFVAVKRRRDTELGGVIRFWPAFGMGLAISAVAGVVYVIGWEATQAATGMDFATSYSNRLIEQQRAAGVSGKALAKYIASMEQFKRDYADPLYRLPMTFAEIFPVGILVSLVSAALLRNSRFMPLRTS